MLGLTVIGQALLERYEALSRKFEAGVEQLEEQVSVHRSLIPFVVMTFLLILYTTLSSTTKTSLSHLPPPPS